MKSHTIIPAVAAIIACATISRAESPDAKALTGTWTPSSAELAGQALPAAVLTTITLKLTEGAYEVNAAGQVDKGTWTIDATTKPKSMSITGTEGPNKGKTFPCIYELEGDTLKVCYDLSGKKRPEEFKSTAGTQLYLVTYKKAAKP